MNPRLYLFSTPCAYDVFRSQTPGSMKALGSGDGNGLASAMMNLSVSSADQPRSPSQSQLSNKPVVISEPAILYLWDMESERFRLQGEVEACIIENEGRDCEFSSG